ncbi:DUF4142 domain-containing protein [Pontibacter rugosus]|uniref:DUF4142 domain-containing protein n=1 Tax=Pontibacter rugosus TaxID=1745966 RepID=A0ABW3SSY3_9BACT
MFLDKVISVTLGAIFLLMLACEDPAAERSEAVAETHTRTLLDDPVFWDYAASSNLLQVQMAELAAKQGSTEHIRNLAREAADYHKQTLQQLKALVKKQEHIKLPIGLEGADKTLVQDFTLLEGEEFDLRYREFVLSTHNAQLNRYEEALTKADDQLTRDWIMDLRSHLRSKINLITQPDSVVMAAQ